MSLLVGGPWEHDVAERLDYQVPWSDWLASGENVSSVSWENETEGFTMSENTVNADNSEQFWITGVPAAAERDYFGEATVETDAGRTFRGHIIIRLRDGGR